MELVADTSWLSAAIKVFYVDLLLGADNALLIALVCRSLPAKERRDALIVGTIAAVLLRAALAGAVGLLLHVPLLRIMGGLVLFAVALTIAQTGKSDTEQEVSLKGDNEHSPTKNPPQSFGSAVALIILADAVMSLDNIVAIGGVAEGRSAVVLVGLALSVPLVMFGGWLLSRLIEQAALVVIIGSLVVGWIAGELAMSDPAVSSWASIQAPALFMVVPALAALFILLDGRWARAIAVRP